MGLWKRAATEPAKFPNLIAIADRERLERHDRQTNCGGENHEQERERETFLEPVRRSA